MHAVTAPVLDHSVRDQGVHRTVPLLWLVYLQSVPGGMLEFHCTGACRRPPSLHVHVNTVQTAPHIWHELKAQYTLTMRRDVLLLLLFGRRPPLLLLLLLLLLAVCLHCCCCYCCCCFSRSAIVVVVVVVEACKASNDPPSDACIVSARLACAMRIGD